MKARAFISKLGRQYPKRLTPIKDVLGLCGSKLSGDINNVVITLDCDDEAIDLALKSNASLIISHHPLLYPNKRIALSNDIVKKTYHRLLDNNLSLFIMHTNFDLSLNGMNIMFGKKLGLKNVQPADLAKSFLFVGETESELGFKAFLDEFKRNLGLEYVLYTEGKNTPKTVSKVGFIIGSAASYYIDAINYGCDVYISGDSKHHLRRTMFHSGLNFIELPHEYEQEIFVNTVNEIVKKIDPEIKTHLNFSQKYHNFF